ncbi:MFS transporter [Actinocrispum sp. NPDC049592]|uniref:MFS transporter n=1 Tax=Actinocrispum sp. NPDC049592 TaxID=3154835 RepID=UPI00342B5B2D
MLRPYRELARVPQALALLTWTLVGRLHQTGTPLAMSFLIAGWTGSYARAGVVAALLMAGLGVAGPVLGRLADKRGAAGQLMVSGVTYGLGLTLVAYLPSWLPAGWWPVEGVLAFTVGLSCPQVAPIARATWPRMLSGSALTSMYTVEATFTELLYAVGPLLAASVVAVLNPALAIVTCGVLATLGSVVFARALTTAGYGGPLPASTRATSSTGLLRAPGVLASLGLMVCLVGALFTVDTTIVALARNMDLPILAGALGAVWAVGSFGGGMIAGGLSGQPRLAFRVLLTLVGLAALIPVLPPLFDPASPWLVGLVLLLGGAAISPAVAAANIVLGELAPADRRAEAFGWASTASTAGFFIALPGSGMLLDHGGPAFAATGATAIGILAVLLTLLIPTPKPALHPTPA